ncbi:MAG: CHAT domain-containing protein [Coleofasciculus sp. S288]|nr:CHAT domain-containing protein [Coleofasciculus sp. S288]
MAKKRYFCFHNHQPQQTPLRLVSRGFARLGWLIPLLLACLTALLCIISSPVFAYLSREVPIAQSTPTAPQLMQQGRDYYEAGRYADAAQVWQQAAQAYQSQGDLLNQAMVLSNLALANQRLGQLPEATAAITTTLELLQLEPDTPNRQRILAQALNTQGSLQMVQGQGEQALATLQQAEAAYKQVDDEEGVIRSLINQAQVMRVLGLYRRARDTLIDVKAMLQEQPDSLLKVAGLRNLGNALRLVGDLNESQNVLQQSLEIAKQLSSPPDIGAALLSLGNTARVKQDPEAALDYYKQAATAGTSPTTQIQAQVNQLSLIADGDIKGDQASLAQPLLLQIQEQLSDLPLSPIGVYARINMAQSLIKLEKESSPFSNTQQVAQILATAIQQAKSLGDSRSQSYALGSLGGLYEKNQKWSDAQNLTEQALVIAQAINASDIAYRWQWQLGRLLKAKGDEEGAIAAYSEAVSTLQSLRSDLVAINSDVQFSFREGVEPVYREFVALLLKSDGTTETSPERLEKARKVIESLQLAELDNFFRAACLTAKPVEIDTIDQKAAIVYPIILPDRLEVILSLPQQPLRHYATPLTQDQVESIVTRLRQLLTRGIGRSYLELSQQIYDWLIRPAEADIAESEVKTLVFVLDGILRSIPMAALHDGQQFLVEKYSIALTPGLELLASQTLAREQLNILSAGLSEGRQGFSPLPNVEVELNEILSEVPGQSLINQEFTEANLRQAINAAPFPVVHLATHGQFSSEAEKTFILTWDSQINVNELNDLLQTTDLRRSKPIELLVLSACQTAIGDKRAALGIAGVAVRAGARSTLATLWSVNDEATAQLMVRFYQELTNTELTKAEALRRAQISILQDAKYRQQPYFWASFILVGNWL